MNDETMSVEQPAADDNQIPAPYVAVFYDERGDVQMGGEGRLSLVEIELMLEIAIRKAKLVQIRAMRQQAESPLNQFSLPPSAKGLAA